ncbi:hypothetical protein GUJ93_ZPchr0004g40082 [Zizania palustris]|uniref:Transposase (putative) gypsy type domain-containing protein n=1 Tax=Zizania palustris TaxID=103762 RepID=A0A8J5S0P8_ZIZPA|nr:hypothetical protein GUJ93_ZPchr0004g40082 [Zizania palustris]
MTKSTLDSANDACVGKVVKKVDFHVSETDVILASRADEAMVFEAFFEAGLKVSTKELLGEVLQMYNLELPQLSSNVVARLAIFELAMRAEGCESRADVFASLHECELLAQEEDL